MFDIAEIFLGCLLRFSMYDRYVFEQQTEKYHIFYRDIVWSVGLIIDVQIEEYGLIYYTSNLYYDGHETVFHTQNMASDWMPEQFPKLTVVTTELYISYYIFNRYSMIFLKKVKNTSYVLCTFKLCPRGQPGFALTTFLSSL